MSKEDVNLTIRVNANVLRYLRERGMRPSVILRDALINIIGVEKYRMLLKSSEGEFTFKEDSIDE